ncbi:MAG: hypothetical protein WCD76_19405 [Pyrinomonadaceae bacterium]
MKRAFVSTFFLCAAALLLLPALALGQSKPIIETRQAVRFDVSRPLRDIVARPAKTSRSDFEPKRFGTAPSSQSNDPVIQSFASPSIAITAGLNFEGVGEGISGFNVNVAPPDTTGDVGDTQYVQWVNLSFAVFDKTSGAMVYGPAAGNTLWSGFGGPCSTSNDGDPLVQWDQLAHRWVLTQFAVPGGTAGYHQCVAVSQTADATGAYNRYQFDYADFNDYPKMGVWPDAYYVTYNMFRGGSTFSGGRVCALDRAKMLAGQAATQQCFQLSTSYGGLLPSDLDGNTAPPAGSPNYVLNFGTNALRMWKFHVDWTTPANTTLTGPTSIPVAAFTTGCGGGTCIPQPGTNQQLDSLADRLMYRLAYRNFGTFQNLVVNHTVKTDTTKRGTKTGVRWYELRNPGGTPTVYQSGSFSPDTNYRWMGSAAMDKVGNLAVGYSLSSGTVKPSLRFAARSATDPLGTLGSETNLLTGNGVQTTGLARWGDYSTLSVDPVDDCTMWFTTEYQAVNGTFNWHTRIANFKLQGCQ